MGDKIKVGDKVRVLRGFESSAFPNLALRQGETYTVTDVTDTGTGHGGSDYGINVDNGDGGHGSWDADRFELVEESVDFGEGEHIDVPPNIQVAHAKAEELFAYLAKSALVAAMENKPGHLGFIREILEQVDDVMYEIEETYPALNRGVL